MAARFSLLTFLLLLLSLKTTTASTVIGATFTTPSAATCPPPAMVSAVSSLRLAAVHLEVSDPNLVRAFLYSNTSLLLSIPNSLVPSLAANRSAALNWLFVHVIPFHPRVAISAISVGSDFLTSTPSDHSSFLLPAILNVHLSLLDLGVRHVSVSTTFSFVNLIAAPFFPPSSSSFLDSPPIDAALRPLLQFLADTNASFLVNLHPYRLYRQLSDVPLGFPLFQHHAFGFRDDAVTGVRYRNLFDMMFDAVVSAMDAAGHDNIPIVVTETGWPSWSDDPREVEANPVYAELYLKGLLGHIKSGRGSPLRREGAKEVYIYELVDKPMKVGRSWGILFANLTDKYKGVDFRSESKRRSILGGFGFVKMVVGQLMVFAFLLNGNAAISLL